MFAIETHPTISAALYVRSWGVWDMPTALAFERAVAAALVALPCVPGEHVVLNDIREFAVQSEEIVLLCRAMFERGEEGRGIAMIVGEGAGRSQLGHVVGDAAVVAFENRDEAEAWLRERRNGRTFNAA
jgi:hypothetical protein